METLAGKGAPSLCGQHQGDAQKMVQCFCARARSGQGPQTVVFLSTAVTAHTESFQIRIPDHPAKPQKSLHTAPTRLLALRSPLACLDPL